MTKCIIMKVWDSVEGNSECHYAMVSLNDEVIAKLLTLIATTKSLVENPPIAGYPVANMQYRDYSVIYFDDDFAMRVLALEEIDELENDQSIEIADSACDSILEYLQDHEGSYRMEGDRLVVTDHSVWWRANCKYGSQRFETESISIDQLKNYIA